MEKQIKVSSITYVKNCAKYIEKCLRSVMNQTLKELEILVCDGGSTDGTLEIIEGLMQQDDRIKLFHTEGSVGLQFNTALRAARGEYIGICEGDDFILPDRYEYQYKLMMENNLDVCRSGSYIAIEKEKAEFAYFMDCSVPPAMLDRVLQKDENPLFFLRTGINTFCSGLYRREFLLDNGIFMNETKGASYQDVGFSFLTQYYAKRYYFTKKAFYCYRIDNAGASFFHNDYEDRCNTEYALLKANIIKRGLWEECGKILDKWQKNSIAWGKHTLLPTNNPLFRFLKKEYRPEMKIAVVGMGPGYKMLVDYLRYLKAHVVYSEINPLCAIVQFGIKNVVPLSQVAANGVDRVILFPPGFTNVAEEKVLAAGISKDKILLFDEPYFFLRYVFA